MPAKKPDTAEVLAEAIRSVFISPNVADSNSEAANLVDVGDKIARAINNLASAIRETFAKE